MKRFIASLLIASTLVTSLSGCFHKHTPGPEATCTEPQICTECEEVLVEALGHEYGPAATCTEPQICTRCHMVMVEALGHTSAGAATCTEPEVCSVCGETISSALGHDVAEDGKCTRCGEQVIPAGQKYVTPGNHGNESDAGDYIEETVNFGHYTNDISAYYAGNVLVCGDYGLEYFLPSASGSSSYADTVNAFARKYPNINTTCLIIPKSCTFNFPSGYEDPYEKTKSFIDNTYAMMDSGIRKADCLGVMTQHEGEYMFYRTDHHWTSLGAYYASVAFCNANGISAYPLDSFETVVRTGFTGTLYGYAGNDWHLEQNPDYTVGHYPHVGYSMTYKNSGAWYNGSAINGNSKSYAGMFICGDNPLTVITTDNKNGKSLIIFKESYGNAFVPYMIDYFEKVVVVDIRQDTASVESIISEYGITDALIINNAQAVISHESYLKAKALS